MLVTRCSALVLRGRALEALFVEGWSPPRMSAMSHLVFQSSHSLFKMKPVLHIVLVVNVC